MPIKRNKKLTSRKSNKKSKVLVLFLALSFLFWILIKLSNEYTDVVQFQVDFINLPKGKIQQDKTNSLDVTVKTFGFNLIKYHLNKRKLVVDLNSIKHKKGMHYYQLSGELLPQIQRQINSDIEVIDIHPDTLHFNFTVKKTKKVPIVSNVEIKYKTGYNLLGEIEIEPKFVTISGAQNTIDSILEVKTQSKEIENVTSSIELTLPLIKDKLSSVEYSVSEVLVKGTVEKITEVKLKLPFVIDNLPKNYTISTIPEQVEIVFLIGVSDYNTINKNEFKIHCDYKKSIQNDLGYLVPEIVSKPSLVSKIRIVPNKIEYLIKK